jgi:uncharacterized membrane protein
MGKAIKPLVVGLDVEFLIFGNRTNYNWGIVMRATKPQMMGLMSLTVIGVYFVHPILAFISMIFFIAIFDR